MMDSKIRELCLKAYGRNKIASMCDMPSRWDRFFLQIHSNPDTARAIMDMNLKRAEEIMKFLQLHQIPAATDEVLDIGCGSGSVTGKLAGAAKHVTGADISEVSRKTAAEYFRSCMISNVDLMFCDINALDPEQAGWINRFDLVFSALTPPCYNLEVIRKMEAMSRKYCFLEMDLVNMDCPAGELVEQVMGNQTVFSHNRIRFFQLLNTILCLEGTFPSVRYYRESCSVEYENEDEYLQRILDATFSSEKTQEQIDQLRTLLRKVKDENGVISSRRELLTGWILWDVRKDEGIRS